MAFALDPCEDLREMRRKVTGLLKFMGNCRILVAKSAHGALYFELEKAGTRVWEISGRPEDFLGQVLNEEEKDPEGTAPAAGSDIPVPEQRAPGYFFVSIRDIQGKRPEFSSKQVLMEFIQRGSFSVLEIICDHVPPWIEVEASQRGYILATQCIAPHEQKIIIRNSVSGGRC
jgi:hypothetical protein